MFKSKKLCNFHSTLITKSLAGMFLSVFRSTFIFLFIIACSNINAQDYFVVIGSFSSQNSAEQFAKQAKDEQYNPQIAKAENKELYYVYILQTTDRKAASVLTTKLQRETRFSDAWLYTRNSTSALVTLAAATDELVKDVIPSETIKEEIPVNTIDEQIPDVEPVPNPEKEPGPSPEKEPGPSPEKEPVNTIGNEPIAAEPPVPAKARGKFFIFQLTTAEGHPVNGKVYNVDKTRGRDLAVYQGNTRVDVLRPSPPETPITLVCETFGYQEQVIVLDYADPGKIPGAEQNSEGVWIVPFTLNHLKKADISVLNDVSFYKDAVIMTAPSKYELDELVAMLNNYPTYKIKIHGHTNGNEKSLRIIKPGSSNNYFDMNQTSSVNGSAKELSRLRAETIKSYLIDNGIEKNRIETYGWGGAAMLAKIGTSAGAKVNNRIEIEILAD
jgi:outer membrane protein OmpA-like peptidoglycan-associated protein